MEAILELFTTRRSGKLGDLIHSRNPSGPYTRPFVIPTNPNTPRQQRVRGRLAAVSEAWGQTLTNDQRDGWADFATRVTVPSRGGGRRHLTGQQLFIRNNAGRTRAFMGIIAEAPAASSNGANRLPEVQTIIGVNLVLILYGDTDEWIRDDGAFMQCFVSDSQTAATNFYAGPFRFAGATPGNSALPPITGDTYGDPFGTVPPGRRWAKTRVVYSDGRCTEARIDRFTFTPV